MALDLFVRGGQDGEFRWSSGHVESVDDDFGHAAALAHFVSVRSNRSPSERALGSADARTGIEKGFMMLKRPAASVHS